MHKLKLKITASILTAIALLAGCTNAKHIGSPYPLDPETKEPKVSGPLEPDSPYHVDQEAVENLSGRAEEILKLAEEGKLKANGFRLIRGLKDVHLYSDKNGDQILVSSAGKALIETDQPCPRNQINRIAIPGAGHAVLNIVNNLPVVAYPAGLATQLNAVIAGTGSELLSNAAEKINMPLEKLNFLSGVVDGFKSALGLTKEPTAEDLANFLKTASDKEREEFFTKQPKKVTDALRGTKSHEEEAEIVKLLFAAKSGEKEKIEKAITALQIDATRNSGIQKLLDEIQRDSAVDVEMIFQKMNTPTGAATARLPKSGELYLGANLRKRDESGNVTGLHFSRLGLKDGRDSKLDTEGYSGALYNEVPVAEGTNVFTQLGAGYIEHKEIRKGGYMLGHGGAWTGEALFGVKQDISDTGSIHAALGPSFKSFRDGETHWGLTGVAGVDEKLPLEIKGVVENTRFSVYGRLSDLDTAAGIGLNLDALGKVPVTVGYSNGLGVIVYPFRVITDDLLKLRRSPERAEKVISLLGQAYDILAGLKYQNLGDVAPLTEEQKIALNNTLVGLRDIASASDNDLPKKLREDLHQCVDTVERVACFKAENKALDETLENVVSIIWQVKDGQRRIARIKSGGVDWGERTPQMLGELSKKSETKKLTKPEVRPNGSGDYTIPANQPFNLDLSATEFYADESTYSMNLGLPNLTLNSATGVISGTPGGGDAGTYTRVITVTNRLGSIQKTIIFRINP